MERKILAAVDGSVYSFNTLRYLARLFKQLPEINLHLLSLVPSTSSTLAKEWMDEQELMNTESAQTRQNITQAKRYLGEAIIQLARHGFNPAQVTTDVKLIRSGVTNEIIHEAQKGMYDALVIGRRGLGKIEEFILGSTSTGVLEKNINVPVWIIDGQVNSRKFLLPVDGTQPCLHAADHLSHILKDNPYAEITLFHSQAMMANKGEIAPHECTPKFGEEWCDLHTSGDDSLFHAPEQILLDSGFPAARIRRLTTSTGIYPSRQIVRQALMDEYGTIVMGRTDSFKKGFFKGTLDKVIAMAVDVAIWIVS